MSTSREPIRPRLTFLTDALGSTIGMVESARTVATNYTYQPFGATTASRLRQRRYVPIHRP